LRQFLLPALHLRSSTRSDRTDDDRAVHPRADRHPANRELRAEQLPRLGHALPRLVSRPARRGDVVLCPKGRFVTVRPQATTWWWILLLGSTPLAHATTDAHWLQHEIEHAPAGATIDVPAGVHAGPFVIA